MYKTIQNEHAPLLKRLYARNEEEEQHIHLMIFTSEI